MGIAMMAFLTAAAGCKYDPQPGEGALGCSIAGECPEGYSCRVNGFCYSTGSGPMDAGASADAGLGGDAVPAAILNRYIGEWTLGVTSMVETNCDDGFSNTSLLSPAGSPSTMTIAPGTPGVSDLDSFWLCALSLRMDATGAHLFDANPTCSDDSADPANTWTATRFDVVTTNGLTGMHNAFYNRVDQYAAGKVVQCTQTVRAPLIKN